MITVLLGLLFAPPTLPQRDQGAPAPGLELLPSPSITAPASAAPMLARLADGRHVRLPGTGLLEPSVPAGIGLPLSGLTSVLLEDAGRARRNLRIHPGGPPLLGRGDAETIRAARSILEGLDRAGLAFEVELAVWLTPGAAKLGTHPSLEVFEAAVAGATPLGRTRLRSGGSAVFGVRRRTEFVAGYDVQVAAGSSVAGPVLGEVLHGNTVHLRAARARAGAGVALEGLLDLAEITEVRSFDTGSADLGQLEQPEVACVQVAFAGLVANGRVLSVAIEGSELGTPDWTLWIQARTSPDPTEPGPWRARDVAWLEDVARTLPVPSPGLGLESVAGLGATEGPTAGSGAAALAQTANGLGARGGLAPIVWSQGLILAPADETRVWDELDRIIERSEARRSSAQELTVRHGRLRVTLPIVESLPLRVLAGRERAQLTGYSLEATTDTWIERPEVGLAFDGILVQGVLVDSELVGVAWRARSGPVRFFERDAVGLARLETRARSFATAAVRIRAGEQAGNALEADGESAALRLLVEGP